MMDITDVVTNCGSTDIESCLSQATNLTATTCDSFVYNYGMLNNRTAWSGAPWGSIIGELNLVCSKSNLDTLLLQAIMLGYGLAGLIAATGFPTDTYGRRKTALFCMATTAVSTLIPATFLRMIPDDRFVLKFGILFICRVLMQAAEVNKLRTQRDLYTLFSLWGG